MTPIYSTDKNRKVKRKRKPIRPLGMISKQLKKEIEKYEIQTAWAWKRS